MMRKYAIVDKNNNHNITSELKIYKYGCFNNYSKLQHIYNHLELH